MSNSSAKYIDGINEEAMDEFLSALRSGSWAQAQGQLENKRAGFCCLGVAARLFHQVVGIERREPSDSGLIWYGDASGALPSAIADYLGIPEANRTDTSHGYVVTTTDIKFFKQGHVDQAGADDDDWDDDNHQTAISWNDTMGKSFAEIADAFDEEFRRPSKYVDGINEQNFDKFLSALRSGDFIQGKSHLESNGKFCCLGVACGLAADEGAVTRYAASVWTVRYDGIGSVMPDCVYDWLGIPESHRFGGDVPFRKNGFKDVWESDGDQMNTAIGWNDGRSKSFLEIADAFEQEFTRES